MKKKYLIRGQDFKARQWAENSPNSDILWIEGSRLLFGFKVIRHSLKLRSSNVIVVQRYLNDYPGYWKSIMLLIMDLLYLSYLKLRGIELWWLCHNINNESETNYHRIIRWRRHLTLSNARRILVTDPVFIKYARLLFKRYNASFEAVSFGTYSAKMDLQRSSRTVTVPLDQPLSFQSIHFADLIELLEEQRQNSEFIGYCGGRVLPKKKYLESIPDLIERSIEEGIAFKILVFSNLNKEKDPKLYNYLLQSPNVIFINSLMELDLFALATHIDFHWTGYTDISMPFSIYAASTTHIPSLSLNIGVIPLLLRHYDIGLTLNKDLSNLKEKLALLEIYDFKYDEFLKEHQWSSFEKLLQNNRI